MSKYIHTDKISSLINKTKEKTTPIELVYKNDLDKWIKNLSKSQHQWVKINNFIATHGSVITFTDNDGKIDFVAYGIDPEELDPWAFSKLSSSLPDGLYKIKSDLFNLAANHAAYGWAMADYKFDRYLKDKNNRSVQLVVPDNCDYEFVCSLVRGTSLTRDLVNTPTCDMGPPELSDAAQELAKAYNADFNVVVGEELLEKGYETIHTVGRAAEKEPRLIDITWGSKKSPKITLVGKGVCFDTGGLDIKPSNAMLIMKKDMGGAAHVLGLGQMIMESGIDVRLRILIPAVENNISGNAFRPGDIIKSYKGTTIEIGNTDAEGRLVLCDALTLACEENPEMVLDFATLTGAARVAMGADVPPYFTDDEELHNGLQFHMKNEHDPLWQLPLYTPYKKLLSSNIADINNVASTGFGGAITAALYLKHFVDNNISWAHFDVYAWNAADRPGRPKGGEAMGLRAVISYLQNKYTN